MVTREDIRRQVFETNLRSVHRRASQLFFWLLIAQWLMAIGLAFLVSTYSWEGVTRTVHVHVYVAVFLGGLINVVPLVLLRTRPEWWLTRQVVAIAQMLWSGLLIHITGGRIETHFHIFGSLAFLAFYCDWRMLPTATFVVAADHLARGLLAPESVYGIINPEWWRFLEHAAWVALENIVLVLACLRAVGEMQVVADREAALAVLNAHVEDQVRLRTLELADAIHSLGKEMTSRLQMEVELRQAQKLEAVGRLASGVAHEINTPVQFVSDSVYFVQEAMVDLFGIVDKLRAVKRSVLDGAPAREAATDATSAEDAADLPYLCENVPIALGRAMEGLGRVATIVRSMKEFAHPDQHEMTTFDLNQSLQSTLTVACNEYKYVAELAVEFTDIPVVKGFVSDLNQVFLNIIVNAAHAIGDVVAGTDRKGVIGVRTYRDGDDVVVAISDTGGGIPEGVESRVFDPFFTTKEVGRGTGQGLSIARAVVVDKHGGQLTFETQAGKGTTFYVRIPIDGGRHRSPLAVAA